MASLVRKPLRVRVSTIGTVVISGGALGIALWQWSDVQEHGAHTYVAQAVVMDGFSVLVTMLVAIAMLLERAGGGRLPAPGGRRRGRNSTCWPWSPPRGPC